MKRGTKIFWIVAGTLLLVGVVAFVSADIAVSRLATREVNKTLAALPFDTASVGAVHVKLFNGLAEVDDIRLAYRGEGLARKKDTVYPGVDIRVERVFVGRLFYSLLVKKEVLVTDLKITRPQVELWMDEEHPELCFPEMPKDTAPMENPLKSIELLRLHVQNADLKLHSLRTQLDLVVDSCSLAVNDLRYDSVFSYCDSVYSLSLQHAAVMLPDGRMRIETSDLEHADQGALRLGKTRIANTMPRKRLGDIVREPITWMDMTVGSVETAPLNPIRKALVRRTGVSSVAMTVCLSCGLYISHVFIPPTPGPIAAAQTLGVGDSLLLVIGLGVLCSIFPLIAGLIYAKFIGKKIKSADELTDNGQVVKTYEELKAEYGKLPGGFNALAPLIVPILLMAASSIVSMAKWTGAVADLLTFLGTPIMALACGTVLAIVQLFTAGKGKDFYTLTNDTLKTVGPILFVTAAGGVLGKVIATSDMVNFITEHASALEAIGIFFPFLLSAILKSAQGSSTVAITTTAGIVAPLLPVLGFTSPVEISLVVMAIGAGAMTVSHANDSYFWVVTNFGEMKPEEGYKTQTLMTLVIGIAAMVEIFILSLIF